MPEDTLLVENPV